MITIKINNLEFLVKSNISVLEACKLLGYLIPRFCYHESLSISGNCRMCLVEVEGSEKPVASCVTEIEDGMSIWLNTTFVKKARENVLEILLINHPLDCPICDQAGECDLQDQTKIFGGDYSRMFKIKTSVEDKNCGPLIKTIMTRCIHCTRCIRFGDEIAGLSFLGTLNRGSSTEIGSYMSKMFESEISGNVIDLCPVGALTSKSYTFKSRPWELRLSENIDLTDGVGSNLYVNFKEVDILRVTPKNNMHINENFISDKARFSFDFLKSNRILSLFEKLNEKFFSFDWLSFSKSITVDKKIIIVNNELGLLSLNFLKSLSYLLGNQFKLVVDLPVKNKNFFYQNSYDFLSNIEDADKNCFVFSSNTKLEACLLNLRLRLKQKKTLLSVNSAGLFYDSDIVSHFIFLDFSKVMRLTEGKYMGCTSLSTDKAPLFILGSNLSSRVSDIFMFNKQLRTYFSNCKIVKVNSFANGEGVEFLGIKSVTRKKVQNSNSVIAIKLDDIFSTRQIFNFCYNKFLFWVSTHGSELSLKSSVIIPTHCAFEEEELYLSLEQRSQYSKKIFKGPENSRSVRSILKSFLDTNQTKNLHSFFFDSLLEVAQNKDLFEKNKSNMFLKQLLLIQNNMVSCNGVTLIKNYPQKSSIEDFYLTGVYTKNSFVMQDCSKKTRKLQINFPKR